MKAVYLNTAAIRRRVRSKDRRLPNEVVQALDRWLESKLDRMCAEHNGGHKTLTVTVFHHVTRGGLI